MRDRSFNSDCDNIDKRIKSRNCEDKKIKDMEDYSQTVNTDTKCNSKGFSKETYIKDKRDKREG